MGGWVMTYEDEEKEVWECAMCNNPQHTIIKTKVETCPVCNNPMCFERETEDMPHEYDVCNECGKHICINCSKYIDETPYCRECYNDIKEYLGEKK